MRVNRGAHGCSRLPGSSDSSVPSLRLLIKSDELRGAKTCHPYKDRRLRRGQHGSVPASRKWLSKPIIFFQQKISVFKYYDEYSAKARRQGRTIALAALG